MPANRAKGYSEFYKNREEVNDEMEETIMPRERSAQQEAAIMYSKQRKGKISKGALRRRLASIYSNASKAKS